MARHCHLAELITNVFKQDVQHIAHLESRIRKTNTGGRASFASETVPGRVREGRGEPA
jgi:hypothetical protein